jgi:hypothetical protein
MIIFAERGNMYKGVLGDEANCDEERYSQSGSRQK